MSESQVFECASCQDRYLFSGTEHVIHRGEEVLDKKNFHMSFKVVVSEFRCAECGAELSNGRWVRRQGDGYEELVNGYWAVTEACEERAKREREAREKVRKAQESVKSKTQPKKDGRRRR